MFEFPSNVEFSLGTPITSSSEITFWVVLNRFIPLLEITLLAITAFIAYKSLVAWRDQAEYQSKREAAKEIFQLSTRCGLWLFEARQSGDAPEHFVRQEVLERSADQIPEHVTEKFNSLSSVAFAKYLLLEKKSDFDELTLALKRGKKYFAASGIDEISDLVDLRETIEFHSSALFDFELKGVPITDPNESRSYCFRVGGDHSIEDRIEAALAKATLI